MFVIISCYRLVNYPKGNNSSGWEELTQTLHTRAFHTSAVTKDGGILLVGLTLIAAFYHSNNRFSMMHKDDQMMIEDHQYRMVMSKKGQLY